MDQLRIRGGRRLAGEIAISGAKNAALPEMCAALLTAERVQLHNVPSLNDVTTMARLLKTLGVDLDQRGNVRANLTDYQTSVPNVFSAGDMRRGQSLVVWAIREGRQAARAVDEYLMGFSDLPR